MRRQLSGSRCAALWSTQQASASSDWSVDTSVVAHPTSPTVYTGCMASEKRPRPLCYSKWNTHTHTHIHLTALCPGLSGWAGTRKVKPIWILLKQETVSGSGISWAVCKSAPRSRPITTPAPHHLFTGRRPSCRPTNSVKALKNVSWQEIYREKDIFRKDGHFSETDRFVKPRVHFIGFQNQRWSYVPKYSVLRSIITEVKNITQRIEYNKL